MFNLFYSPLEQFEQYLLFSLFDNLFITNMLVFFYDVVIVCSFLLVVTFFVNSSFYSFWQRLFIFYTSFLVELFKQQVSRNHKNAFFVLIFTLFNFILFSNLLGLCFYGFTVTSHISVTFTLSSIFFWAIVIVGFYLHGMHFFDLLKPSDVPPQLFHFLFVIEFISYLSRVFSLAIRLFANMMAGHTLLYIIGSFFFFLISQYAIYYIFAAFLVANAILFVLILELAVAFLQSYVFTVLVCIYLNDSLEGKH